MPELLGVDTVAFDPEIPRAARQLLAQVPVQELIPFAAGVPEPAPGQPPAGAPRAPAPRRRLRTTPQARWSAGLVVLSVLFLGSAWTLASLRDSGPLTAAAAAMVNLAWLTLMGTVVGWFVAGVNGWAWLERRRAGQLPAVADAASLTMTAVRVYHRHYVVPRRDLDAESRGYWARAVSARNQVCQAAVIAEQAIDAPQLLMLLPVHLWDIARTLAEVSALRARQRQILRGLDADDPEVRVILEPQLQAQAASMATVAGHVRALEQLADLVSIADAARRREAAVRRLAGLNDAHLDLLARQGAAAAELGAAGQIPAEVRAVTEQANEAVRQVNEAARGLMLPGAADGPAAA